MNYDENRWFSLRFGVYHLWKLRKVFGEKVITSTKYQKEREAWIVAVTLLGITKITKETWWIQIPKEDIPDIRAMTLTPDENKNWNYVNYRDVEVMEITKYSKNNIIEEILHKIKDKYYGNKTGLVVYLRRDENIPDMKLLSQKLRDKIKNIADIWIVGNTKPNTNDFIVFSIFPDVQVINFNVDEEIIKILPGDTIDLSRAKGTKAELIKGEFYVVFNPKVTKR
ncbi:MAG TPA: hypothetical protein VLF20_06015 [Patescibacteria group bacterium]|nr:hypothetical protein [Patescibacteria group bacterium]